MSRPLASFALIALLALAGCGSSSKSSTSAGAGGAGGGSAGSGGTTGPEALAADARSAATGDIPDSQAFLTLHQPGLGFSMIYPEGWTVRNKPPVVSIVEKNNLIRVAISSGQAPSIATVQADLAKLKTSTPNLNAGTPTAISLPSGKAVKVKYTTVSAPNPVTGKQVTLTVDRYVLASGGKVATVDLGTPVGVDNVDAYKRVIGSFRWR